jgi:hypothetical protein
VPVSRWSLPDPSTRVPSLPTPTRVDGRHVESVAGWLLVIGGGLCVLGSLLPWSVITAVKTVLSVDALHGDGRFTLPLGLIIVAIGILTLGGRVGLRLAVVVTVLSVAVTAIAVYNAIDLDALGTAANEEASLELGHGLVITLIGAVLGVIGGARLVARG